jgi:hypothetical protein
VGLLQKITFSPRAANSIFIDEEDSWNLIFAGVFLKCDLNIINGKLLLDFFNALIFQEMLLWRYRKAIALQAPCLQAW